MHPTYTQAIAGQHQEDLLARATARRLGHLPRGHGSPRSRQLLGIPRWLRQHSWQDRRSYRVVAR